MCIIIDSKRNKNFNFFEKKNAMNIESLEEFDYLIVIIIMKIYS